MERFLYEILFGCVNAEPGKTHTIINTEEVHASKYMQISPLCSGASNVQESTRARRCRLAARVRLRGRHEDRRRQLKLFVRRAGSAPSTPVLAGVVEPERGLSMGSMGVSHPSVGSERVLAMAAVASGEEGEAGRAARPPSSPPLQSPSSRDRRWVLSPIVFDTL